MVRLEACPAGSSLGRQISPWRRRILSRPLLSRLTSGPSTTLAPSNAICVASHSPFINPVIHSVRVHNLRSRVDDAVHGTCCVDCVTQCWTRSRIPAHLRSSRSCYNAMEAHPPQPDTDASQRPRAQEIADQSAESSSHLSAWTSHFRAASSMFCDSWALVLAEWCSSMRA